MALTFTDTHNMIAYLTKSDASEEFNQIINFLNASSIQKKVIIIEATVQEALRLDDAESIDCLPNVEIFIDLSRMGTSWNEFSSSMASAFICLSTGMIVAQQDDDVADEVAAGVDDVPAADAEPTIPSPTPTTQPPPSQELPSTSHVISTPPSSPIAEPSSPPQQQQPSQPTHDA
uniref:Uncharacterized protein n=1 Tax=Tanacetum cinerariifolium TaxID=118510 RepID=A0A699ID77_TANCI|nr:hypothetical protein [Tanacetum cinerariifolium]